MVKNWYVVHTYSGYEDKVKRSIERKFKALGREDKLGQIIVPTEEIAKVKNGKKKVTFKKFYPGYVLVQMELDDESWHMVRSIPKVTGFVGSGRRPLSLPEDEVKAILSEMGEAKAKPKPKVLFEKGETVKVIEGPFTNFTGVVEEVNQERGKLKIMVTIFGRSTPIELDLLQVEKM